MESFIATSGNRYSVDRDKVRFSAMRTENIGQVAYLGADLPVVAPVKTAGVGNGHRDVALPMGDVLEIALDFLRGELMDKLRRAEGDELKRLLGF